MAQIVYYVAAALALGAPDRRGGLRRADRQFRQCLRRLGGARRWACRSRGWSSAPTATTSSTRFFKIGRHDDGRRWCRRLQPAHGHPGLQQFRAAAVRAAATATPTGCSALMAEFRGTGRFSVTPAMHEAATRAVRQPPPGRRGHARRHRRDSTPRPARLIDPHTAIGIAAARAHPAGPGIPMVALATAHPGQVPGCGRARHRLRARRCRRISPTCIERAERLTVLPNDLAAVEAFVRAVRAPNGGPA